VDVAADVLPAPGQVEHDVGNPLAGPVIGILSSPSCAVDGKAAGLQQVGLPGAGPGGIEGRVLQEPDQIAGRAGRHMNDGTFGVTGQVPPFEAALAALGGAVAAFEHEGGPRWRMIAHYAGEPDRAALAAAQAKVAEAEATVVEMQRNLDRITQLATKNFSTQKDLDAAKAAYDRAIAGLTSAKADVAVAKADLDLNETNLRKACICSPIDGVVLVRNVEPGQTVASSLQAPILFRLAESLTKMQIEVDVDEADIGKVREGQSASFQVEAYPDRKFPATISQLRLAPETVEGVVTYKAVLTVDNAGLLLRPGMTATAEITVEEMKDILLVPNAALRFTPIKISGESTGAGGLLSRILPHRPQRQAVSTNQAVKGGQRQLWVLRGGEANSVVVTVGASDGSRTEVVSGDLAPGDPVIVDMVMTQ